MAPGYRTKTISACRVNCCTFFLVMCWKTFGKVKCTTWSQISYTLWYSSHFNTRITPLHSGKGLMVWEHKNLCWIWPLEIISLACNELQGHLWQTPLVSVTTGCDVEEETDSDRWKEKRWGNFSQGLTWAYIQNGLYSSDPYYLKA